MFGAKAYGVLSTVISTVTIGASVNPNPAVIMRVGGVVPTDVPFIGPVPIFAVAVGVLTALLVREVARASDPNKLWRYNAAVTALAVVGSAVFIIDHRIGPGNAFWVGGSFGAMGAGTVSVMRSRFASLLLDALRDAFGKAMKPPAGGDGSKSE